MNPLLLIGYKSSDSMNIRLKLCLLVGLALAGCGTSAGQLRWQPALVLASGSPLVTLPRIPAHPATTADCSDTPAPSQTGSSLDGDGDHPASSTSSGEEDNGGGGGGVTMSGESAEEDESAGWE